MSEHLVTLTVRLRMTEMDGTAEQSAEIAQDLVYEAIRDSWDADAEVSVTEYYDVSA